MRKTSIDILAIVSASILSIDVQACGYQGGKYNYIGGEVYARMTMSRNETCSHIFMGRGTDAMFVALRVVEKPRHGLVSSASDKSFAFKPDPNFSGKDSFVIENRRRECWEACNDEAERRCGSRKSVD